MYGQVALAQKLTTEQQLQEQVAAVLARHREQMLDVDMTEAQVLSRLITTVRNHV
jgi:hypothetical protein